MFAGADEVVAVKGKKCVTFRPQAADCDREALAAAVIGPSGNLRAPALRCGRRWVVGFDPALYAERLGARA